MTRPGKSLRPADVRRFANVCLGTAAILLFAEIVASYLGHPVLSQLLLWGEGVFLAFAVAGLIAKLVGRDPSDTDIVS
jgi:hypothetical protein